MKRNKFKELSQNDCSNFDVAYEASRDFIKALKHKLIFSQDQRKSNSSEIKKQYSLVFSRIWILLTTNFIQSEVAKESLTLNALSLFYSIFFENKDGEFNWTSQNFV